MPRIFTNSPSVATWGSFIARALPLGILSPLVLSQYSQVDGAIWLICITLQGLQLLLESSVGAAFIRAIGFALGGATQVKDLRNIPLTNDRTEVPPNTALFSKIWGAMGVAYLGVALLTGAMVVALAWISVPALLADSEHPSIALATVVIFVVGAVLRAYYGRHISYLFATGHIPALRWSEAGFWAISFAASLIVVWAGGSLMALALAYQVPPLVNLLWNRILVAGDQKDRLDFNQQAGFHIDIIRQLWPAMWRSSLGIAVYLVATQGAGLYYARIGSPADVATLLFAMSLLRPMMQFAQVPFFTKTPELARLQASGQRDQQVKVAQRGMALSHWMMVGMIMIVGTALPIIIYITGAKTSVPATLWMILGLTAFIERLGAMHLQFYSVTNHILWHWVNGITTIVFLGLSVILLPHAGLYAFPIAQCISVVMLYMPISIYWSYRGFKLPVPGFEIKTTLLPLLVLITYFMLLSLGLAQ